MLCLSICVECMVGDVNLFFNDPDDKSAAELEIMVAGVCVCVCV